MKNSADFGGCYVDNTLLDLQNRPFSKMAAENLNE